MFSSLAISCSKAVSIRVERSSMAMASFLRFRSAVMTSVTFAFSALYSSFFSGVAGERLADTVARVGFEKAEAMILSNELLERKEEILAK